MLNMKSIVTKTAVVLAVAISILLAIMGVFFILSEKNFIENTQDRNIKNIQKQIEARKNSELKSMQDYLNFVTATIANVSAEYLYNVDESGLKVQIENFMSIKELIAVEVIDISSGKVFLSSYKDGSSIKFTQSLSEFLKDKNLKIITKDSLYQNNRIGKTTLYYTDEEIIRSIEKTKLDAQDSFEKEKEIAQNLIREAITTQAIALIFIVLILVFLTVILLNKFVRKPLDVFKHAMIDLVNKKDTAADYISIMADDEVGEVTKYFNRYITKIVYGSEMDNSLIGDAVSVVESVKSGYLKNRLTEDKQNLSMYKLQKVVNDMLETLYQYTQDILDTLKSYSNDDYTRRSNKANVEGEVGELIDGVNKLGDSLSKMLSVNLKNGLSLEDDSNKIAQNTHTLSETFDRQMELIKKTTKVLEKMTNELQSNEMKINSMTTHAQEMKAVIDIIGDIADQTNLLALNAAIEAARAGEHGRGFAVVSDEVRKLAEKTQKSLSEINSGINALIQSVEDVADTFKEQAKAIEGVNTTITTIDKMAQESVETTKKVANISKDVSHMAVELVKDSRNKKFNVVNN